MTYPSSCRPALALCVAILVACGRPAASVPTARSAAEIGYQRLLGATTLDGAPVAERLSGGRATVVIVFASWCGACRAELGVLGRVRGDFPDVRILGVNAYEEWGAYSDEQRLRGFLANTAPWLEVVHGDEGLLEAFGGVPKIPTLFVFDGRGALLAEYRRQHRRMPDEAELRAVLEGGSGG